MNLFADDTRIHKEIRTLQDIQDDLYKIYKWTEDSKMGLNGDKFEHMRYGKHHGPDLDTNYLTPDGQNITLNSSSHSEYRKTNKNLNSMVT